MSRSHRDFSVALGMDPHNIQAHLNLGMVLMAERQWSAALSRFELVLKLVEKTNKVLHRVPYASFL